MEKNSKKYQNTFCISGDIKELEKIRDFVNYWASDFGFNEIDANKIVLAVDEVCTNIIKHALKDNNSKIICVKIETNKPDFNIIISDNTPSFDLTEKDNINLEEYLSKFKKGGLGIQIIKNVMDEIKYFPSNQNNQHNVLYLRKQLH
jgi:serine/threonine-protein kinase RsbW